MESWLVTLIVGLFGGGALATVVVKLLSKNVDNATAEKIKAEARSTAQQTAAGEVDTLRQIIAEVRESEAKKTARIDALEQRLEKLEERERHALTRAAVHEAWDQLAFNFINGHDRNFPKPPPLSYRGLPTPSEGDGS
jgi:hypothetical protein